MAFSEIRSLYKLRRELGTSPSLRYMLENTQTIAAWVLDSAADAAEDRRQRLSGFIGHDLVVGYRDHYNRAPCILFAITAREIRPEYDDTSSPPDWCHYADTAYALDQYSNEFMLRDNMARFNGHWYERELFWEDHSECGQCGETFENDDLDDGWCSSCHESEEEERESRRHSEFLHEYHDYRPGWRVFGDASKEFTLGLEVEVDANGGESRNEVVEHLFHKANANREHVIFETDGSLNDSYGFEMVAMPMTLSYATEFWRGLMPSLVRNCVGYDTEESYGIHISLDREQLSPMQEVRIQGFFYEPANAQFNKAIAQRVYGYSSTRNIGDGMELSSLNKGMLTEYKQITVPRVQVAPGVYKAEQEHTVEVKKKFGGMGKYTCVNMDDYRAEIRVFQSTLRLTSFMKNLEFVDALASWTHLSQATGFTFRYEQFLQWLNESGRWGRYPHQLTYLRQPEYRVKNYGPAKLQNAWLHLLPRPNPRQELEVVQCA